MKTQFIVMLLLISGAVSAQQDAQYTQYMYNTVNVNPAYAGSRQSMNIFALHRTQWVGLDGAPVTSTLSLNTPINNSRVGLGVSVINDKIGPSDESNIAVDFSYNIDTSEKFKLAFGIKASANLLNVNFSKLNQYDTNDYSFENNIDNKFSPNIGVGFYWYSDRAYIGLSAPNLLETKHFDRYAGNGANSYIARERINYYLTAGHVFDLDYNLKFKPAIMTKLVQGAPLQVDVSANFLINDKFTVGAAYRWSAALSALVGFQISESLFIGYGYDLETTRLANYNSGSHEVFLRYEIFKSFNRMVSPRFF
jgi:type IX secretion system PorP/SprF family membrane protein